jgi:hypothetical protein
MIIFILRALTTFRNAMIRRLPAQTISRDQIELEISATNAFTEALRINLKRGQ